MATMHNFRASDMPGGSQESAKPAEEEAPKVEQPKVEKKAAAPKKASAKKAPAAKKEAAPAVEPQNTPPADTDTETHGVGPTDVDAVAPVGVQGDDQKNED